MERVMLTLPAELLEAVDTMARHQGKKRSEVVRQALRELLERQRQQEFEAALAEGYQALAEQVATSVRDSLPLQAAAVEGVWRWDE